MDEPINPCYLEERKIQGKQQWIQVEDIEEESLCAACGNEYNEGQEWVGDSCSPWYERLCTDIVSDQRWEDITTGREPWFCCERQMRQTSMHNNVFHTNCHQLPPSTSCDPRWGPEKTTAKFLSISVTDYSDVDYQEV